ncbi:hypothetical protein EOK75_06020 [Pseudorhodobacter turbinis]|uniref:Chlorhexidine efflux transporter domain-containing protein n=1 Tax=Pseudorhodobacter turbinis TaxID=2500533 RepID=A0A4P8EEV8_9RHOB|nr:hypothetical protein EOK75_06020 [Pseudorhodobacter turbinis]
MRTSYDRIRHALCFEIIGLLLIVPLGAMGFGMNAQDIGAIWTWTCPDLVPVSFERYSQ